MGRCVCVCLRACVRVASFYMCETLALRLGGSTGWDQNHHHHHHGAPTWAREPKHTHARFLTHCLLYLHYRSRALIARAVSAGFITREVGDSLKLLAIDIREKALSIRAEPSGMAPEKTDALREAWDGSE